MAISDPAAMKLGGLDSNADAIGLQVPTGLELAIGLGLARAWARASYRARARASGSSQVNLLLWCDGGAGRRDWSASMDTERPPYTAPPPKDA